MTLHTETYSKHSQNRPKSEPKIGQNHWKSMEIRPGRSLLYGESPRTHKAIEDCNNPFSIDGTPNGGLGGRRSLRIGGCAAAIGTAVVETAAMEPRLLNPYAISKTWGGGFPCF